MPAGDHTGIDSARSVASVREIEAFRWKLPWDASEEALDSAEAQVTLARGRLIYTRFLFTTFG